MESNIKNEYFDRKKKLNEIKKLNINIYPDRFERTHIISQIKMLSLSTVEICTAGRILSKRVMGKIIFLHILDTSDKIQLVVKRDVLGQEKYQLFQKIFDIGDFIGVLGDLFKTNKGEISILAKNYTFLGKALRPLPEKWHGLKDTELLYRQRYLDLISNPDTKKRFIFRSNFIKILRQFYEKNDFIEIETPILGNTASGAMAKPFVTHHHALDIDVYLRISVGELWQKMAIIGGFEKVFEIGKVFRNEGMDPSHLQEFTAVEHYSAYWNYQDNMRFTQELFQYLLEKLFGTLIIKLKNRQGKTCEIDFTPPWPQKSFRDLIFKDCGIDIDKFKTRTKLLNEIQKKKIPIQDLDKLSMGNLIDELYKNVSREKIIQPTFLTQHPLETSPLARKNDSNSQIVDRFQLIVNGWEIVNAYSELVDPQEQSMRFKEQAKDRQRGDLLAHGEDDEYITALEYGAPPISGWGMGIDRMVALLTQQENLRDVILFPLLKPEKK